ncbi:unnamed protein product [Trichogramma brassicae]|uniref:Sensory neuron membrane protein 1 n=1 Tax=Trichogramma brassicae TaxID=86971 RepID=A0A6H5IBZ6_9HYME|nr:unnamed protein product [Trichogramma brassicae]
MKFKIDRPFKYTFSGISAVVLGILVGWVFFPMLLEQQTHAQVNLKEGGEMRDIWSKFPFPLEFKVFLFNITNPDEIEKGEKPRVQQVGPYFFEEWQEKVDLADREEDDSVEYALKNKWIFVPEKSEGLTGNEELVLPHLFILSLAMTVSRTMPKSMALANKAIDSIFKHPTSLFQKMTAMDFLFNGLPVDCTVEDFAGTAVCSRVKEQAEGTLVPDGTDRYRFSLLGARNDTAVKKRVRVKRGIEVLNEIGLVTEWDGKLNIAKWNDTYCDTLNGTDGTIFHPQLFETENVVSFSPELCRSLSASFEEKSSVEGVPTNRYGIFLGDPNTDPSQRCYCPSPDNCLKAGVMDLFKCVEVPLVASHPHFYLADPEYLQMVDGLDPSKDEHAVIVDFEPITGTPLNARKRLQYNMMVHKVDKLRLMHNFSEALLPLFWVEEGVVLPEDLMSKIKMSLLFLTVSAYLIWIQIIVGLCLTAFGGYLYYKARRTSHSFTINKKRKHKSGGTERNYTF